MIRLLLSCSLACMLVTHHTARAADDCRDGFGALEEYNYTRALPLIEKCAEAGDMRAQEALGMLMIHGEALLGSSIDSDPARAYEWLSRAAAQGSEPARHVLQVWARRGLDNAASVAESLRAERAALRARRSGGD